MSISETIIIGIITGVATSVLIALSILIFNGVIVPWYRQTIYKGIDVSGEWSSSLEIKGVKETFIMNIRQKANSISCLMTVNIHHSDKDTEIKTYKLNGIFEDRFLSLIGKNINKQNIGVNVMLLEIRDGGNKMLGKEAWFSTVHNKIDSEDVEWTRT